MSNTFVTPKAVSTIAQSRIDYNQSVTSLLDNFASTGAPSPGSISLEGTTGLRDITSHTNFPWLNEEDWPNKPQ